MENNRDIAKLQHYVYLRENFDLTQAEYLGRGGFGLVFTAPTKITRRFYAIKILMASEQSSFKSRMKELSIMLTLNDGPHIVKIENNYSDGFKDEIIIVMEKGESNLSDVIKIQRFSKEELGQMIVDLTTALLYASKKGIVHSDIKPKNIIVFTVENRNLEENTQKIYAPNKKTIYKLIDWGSGHIIGSLANRTANVNTAISYTPGYFAPELNAIDKELNLSKADIYSLGLTILNACGVNYNDFMDLCMINDKKDHKKKVKKLLKKGKIKENYGEKIKNLIKRMICFEYRKRPDCQKILNEFTNLIEKEIEVRLAVHFVYSIFVEIRRTGGEMSPKLKDNLYRIMKENYEPIAYASQNMNFDEAHVLLGRMYYMGVELPKDENMALIYFQKAEALGNHWGVFCIGSYYDFIKEDYNKAFENYKRSEKIAIKKGTHCWSALNNLADFYCRGLVVGQNDQKARKLYRTGVAQGNSIAQFGLGELLIDGVVENRADGERLIAASAKQGNTYAMELLKEREIDIEYE